MIFNGVVGATIKDFRNFGPLVVQGSVFQKENPLFFFAPANFLYLWIQMVVPALSALLSSPVLQMLGYLGPLFRSVLLYELKDLPVFSFRPRPLDYQFLLTLPPHHSICCRLPPHTLRNTVKQSILTYLLMVTLSA